MRRIPYRIRSTKIVMTIHARSMNTMKTIICTILHFGVNTMAEKHMKDIGTTAMKHWSILNDHWTALLCSMPKMTLKNWVPLLPESSPSNF
mmetsp:Transcript_34496/g.74961  ORF Transcript_34496/g.74961 Transcript_34496/m.74961 type:complete len:91 (+) Transcript_34496:378-650(+)